MLTTREKADIAIDLTEMLPSSAQIKRPTNTSDGLGGRSQAFSTAATVACRITSNSMNAEDGQASDKIIDTEPYRIAFPAGTDVRITDRLLINSITYSVEAVRGNHSVEIERVVYARKAAA